MKDEHPDKTHEPCWHEQRAETTRYGYEGTRRESNVCCLCGALRVRTFTLMPLEDHGPHAPKAWKQDAPKVPAPA